MIEKYCHVQAFDPVHGQQVFVLPVSDLFEKTASITKEAQVSEAIAEAIEGLKPERGHRYVLVNGIGAGEYWSSNKNGDYFPETGLKHAGEDYGFETFLSGHNFIHHQNKDPLKSVGTVKAAHYNERMHRVELLLDTDMAKLAKADPAIYEKVARGEPVDVSMGSKCDFDVCSLCSNRAATRAEYCAHLKTAMNQVMGDGRKAYAYTPHPRFFDISYVTKGADVTAKALHYLDKAASENTHPQRDSATGRTACPDPSLHETVSCEEPEYEIPAFPAEERRATLLLEAVEPGIPTADLNLMAKAGFKQALSTASHLGIVLKPEEYQRVALVALGEEKLADALERAGASIDASDVGSWFDPSINEFPDLISPENWDSKVAEVLAPHAAKRSIFEPYFSERLAAAKRIPAGTVEKLARSREFEKAAGFMTAELAAALALGYLVYRKTAPAAETDVLRKAMHDPSTAKKVMPVILALIAGGSIVDKMLSYNPPTGQQKAAGVGSVLLPVAGTYLYSAYARRKAEQGRPVSGLEHMFIDYPLPLSLAGVAGATALSARMKRTMGKSSAIIAPMKKTGGMAGELGLLMGSGAVRPRLAGVIGGAADIAIFNALATLIGGGSPAAKEKSRTSQ